MIEKERMILERRKTGSAEHKAVRSGILHNSNEGYIMILQQAEYSEAFHTFRHPALAVTDFPGDSYFKIKAKKSLLLD